MRDRARWNEAKTRARAEAELVGVEDGRAIVRQARAEYLVLSEIASASPTTEPSSPSTSPRTSASVPPLAPLVITPEALRSWQERNRAQATDAEMDQAVRLLLREEACALCEGARFVRDPAFKPGHSTVPVLGSGTATFPGTMPCPDCNAKPSVDWLRSRSNVPSNLWGLDFDSVERHAGKGEAIDAIAEWVELVAAGKCPQSLVLHGLPGRGKTHLAIASVLRCCETGTRAEFWPLQSLLREMQQRFGAEDDSAQAFEDRVTRVPVLVLDDVGAEQRSRSDWSTEVFERLLDVRINAGLSTLLTTNLDPLALAKHVDSRAASRLRLFRHIELGGADMRAVLGRRMAEART